MSELESLLNLCCVTLLTGHRYVLGLILFSNVNTRLSRNGNCDHGYQHQSLSLTRKLPWVNDASPPKIIENSVSGEPWLFEKFVLLSAISSSKLGF